MDLQLLLILQPLLQRAKSRRARIIAVVLLSALLALVLRSGLFNSLGPNTHPAR